MVRISQQNFALEILLELGRRESFDASNGTDGLYKNELVAGEDERKRERER